MLCRVTSVVVFVSELSPFTISIHSCNIFLDKCKIKLDKTDRKPIPGKYEKNRKKMSEYFSNVYYQGILNVITCGSIDNVEVLIDISCSLRV